MKRTLSLATLWMLAACTAMYSAGCTPDAIDDIEGIGDDDLDADVTETETDAGLTPSPRGYIVVSGDYTVVSLGVLRADGSVRTRELIHSGSATTGLVTALSGDVAIPNNLTDPGVLTILDRFRTDVITRLDLASGEVLGQVKTHAPNAESNDAYSSNPQDYLYVDSRTAWVSRYEPNLNAASDSPERGIDLLRIDPTRFERTTDRIDFWPWNEDVEREDMATGESRQVTLYARPASIVARGTRGAYAVVGIDRNSVAFDPIGQGAVALVDLEAQRVMQVLEMEGLESCTDVNAIPDDELRVEVACTGFVLGVQREGAGIAIVALEDDELVLERVWRASDDPESALSIYATCPLSATDVLAVAPGGVADGSDNDILFRLDLTTGEQDRVLEAGGAFVLGSPAFDPRSGLVLAPDASTDAQARPSAGVHRYQLRDNGELEPIDVIALDAVLPAHQVRVFY